jgi:hypothetical protein
MSLSPQTAAASAVAIGLAKSLRSFDPMRRDRRAWQAGFQHAVDCCDRLTKQATDAAGFERESYLSGYSDGLRVRLPLWVVLP